MRKRLLWVLTAFLLLTALVIAVPGVPNRVNEIAENSTIQKHIIFNGTGYDFEHGKLSFTSANASGDLNATGKVKGGILYQGGKTLNNTIHAFENKSQLGGEVSGTPDNVVLSNTALDDQYVELGGDTTTGHYQFDSVDANTFYKNVTGEPWLEDDSDGTLNSLAINGGCLAGGINLNADGTSCFSNMTTFLDDIFVANVTLLNWTVLDNLTVYGYVRLKNGAFVSCGKLYTDSDGLVVCGTDANTLYYAGMGLTLDGAKFNINPAVVVNYSSQSNLNVNRSNWWDGYDTPTGDIVCAGIASCSGADRLPGADVTITATEVDGSVTNEIQDLTLGGAAGNKIVNITGSTKGVTCQQLTGGAELCDGTDDIGGAGASAAWLDMGEYVTLNSSFADNINVSGQVVIGGAVAKAGTGGLNMSGGLFVYGQNSYLKHSDFASCGKLYTGADGKITCGTDADTWNTTEQMEDVVGTMLGGTETRITVTYDDVNNDIDFVVDDMIQTLSVTGAAGNKAVNASGTTTGAKCTDLTGGAGLCDGTDADTTQTLSLTGDAGNKAVNISLSTAGVTCQQLTGGAGLCDGTDAGTDYTAGMGLALDGTTFNINPAVVVNYTDTRSLKVTGDVNATGKVRGGILYQGGKTLNNTIHAFENKSQLGGEVSGTPDNVVLSNDALDDQYYDSEADLTGLLDNNYMVIAGKPVVDASNITSGVISNARYNNSFLFNKSGTLTDTKLCTYSADAGTVVCNTDPSSYDDSALWTNASTQFKMIKASEANNTWLWSNASDQDTRIIALEGAGYITAAGVPAAETDAAHDTCAEISGCVVGAISSTAPQDKNITNLWSNASNQDSRITVLETTGHDAQDNNITSLWSNASGQGAKLTLLNASVETLNINDPSDYDQESDLTGLLDDNYAAITHYHIDYYVNWSWIPENLLNWSAAPSCGAGEYWTYDGSTWDCATPASTTASDVYLNITANKNNITALWGNASDQEGKLALLNASVETLNINDPSDYDQESDLTGLLNDNYMAIAGKPVIDASNITSGVIPNARYNNSFLLNKSGQSNLNVNRSNWWDGYDTPTGDIVCAGIASCSGADRLPGADVTITATEVGDISAVTAGNGLGGGGTSGTVTLAVSSVTSKNISDMDSAGDCAAGVACGGGHTHTEYAALTGGTFTGSVTVGDTNDDLKVADGYAEICDGGVGCASGLGDGWVGIEGNVNATSNTFALYAGSGGVGMFRNSTSLWLTFP